MADYTVRLTGQDNLTPELNKAKQALNDLGNNANQLDKISQKFQRIESSSAPLKRKLKDLQTIMADMNLKGLSGTAEFAQLAEAAARYKDSIADANQAVRLLASDTAGLDAGIQALQGLAAAGGLATGVMGLLGTENEKVQQAMLKVQSVLAILNSLQTISNVLNKDSVLMLKLKQKWQKISAVTVKSETVALNANTAAGVLNNSTTKKGTVVQNAWNVAKAVAKALLGDFTGLALVGAGALATYAIATANSSDKLEDQSKSIDKVKESMQKYRDNFATNAGSLIAKYKLLQNEWNNLKTVSEKNQFIKDNATEISNLGGKVNDLVTAEKFFIDQTGKVENALKARASAMAAQSLVTEAYENYYKTIMDADNSVAGGGYYNVYKKGGGALKSSQFGTLSDEAIAAGVTIRDLETSTYSYSSTYGTVSSTTYKETQAVVDKINRYRQKQANETNKKIKADAEESLNKTVQFAVDKIDAANKTIEDSGLDFGNGKPDKPDKPQKPAYDEGSLAAEKAELQRLQDVLNKTKWESEEARNAAIKAVQDQAAKVKSLELQLQWEVKPELDMSDDTVRGLENQLKEINRRLQEEVLSDEERQELVIQKNAKIQLKTELEIKNGDKTQEVKPNTTIKPETIIPNYLAGSKQDKRDSWNNANSIATQYVDDFNAGIISATELTDKIAELNTELEKLGLQKLSLEIDDGGTMANVITETERAANARQKMADGIQQVGDAFVNLGNSLGGLIEDEGAKKAVLIATAIGQIALSFAKSLQGTFTPWDWIAAAISGAAVMTSLVAQLSSFADGGIISGNRFHGDNQLVRVNSGEMILNQKQQSNLFRMLNNGGNTNAGGHVEFHISGSSLKGVLRNYDNKMNKIR